jgi:hypothetical protein
MNVTQKAVLALAAQILRAKVQMPLAVSPHTIKHDNQSIKNGVIDEKSDLDLRGESIPRKKRGRRKKSIG